MKSGEKILEIRLETTRDGGDAAETPGTPGSAWVAPPTDRLVLYRDQAQFNRASRTNCQPDSQPIPKPEGCPDEEVT